MTQRIEASDATQPRAARIPMTRIPSSSKLGGALITAIAWILSRWAVGVATPAARFPFLFKPHAWLMWDAKNYLSIAMHGRTYGRCGTRGIPYDNLSRDLGATSCGTAGWLPGYPWLMRALHTLGIPLLDAGMIISSIAMFVALYLLWLGWGRSLAPTRALAVLLLFGLFPGAVYNFGLFPTSVALAFVTGAMLAAVRERFPIAAILMICAGLCYPSVWFGAVGFAAAIVLLAIPLGRDVAVRRGVWGVVSLGGVILLMMIDEFNLGNYNAYFLVQDQGNALYQYSISAPYDLFVRQSTYVQTSMGYWGSMLLALQSLVGIALSVVAAFIACIKNKLRNWNAELAYPALFGIATMGGLIFSERPGTWTRSLVVAAPCVVCFRKSPPWLLWATTALVGVITIATSRYFFTGQLV